MLSLPYPGGPEIERKAIGGGSEAYHFPRSMPGELNFSFSGLKTAVRYTLSGIDNIDAKLPDICASFQKAVVDVLTSKSLLAARKHGCSLITLSGGVSCNKALRVSLEGRCRDEGFRFLACPSSLSTDNAAMISFAALLKIRAGATSSLDEDIDPNLSLCIQGPIS